MTDVPTDQVNYIMGSHWYRESSQQISDLYLKLKPRKLDLPRNFLPSYGCCHLFYYRFKPAYNPYTEPSMEIFSYHEGLQKWVEIGNSGIYIFLLPNPPY